MDCGPYDINFFNDDATETTLDPDLFEVNKATSQIITKYTDDVTKKANYPISYRVSYTNYAATTFVKTTTPFTISVQDPCDSPVSVTPSVLTNQEYILTDLDTAPYTVPVYTADPSWCAIVYTYTVTDPSGD